MATIGAAGEMQAPTATGAARGRGPPLVAETGAGTLLGRGETPPRLAVVERGLQTPRPELSNGVRPRPARLLPKKLKYVSPPAAQRFQVLWPMLTPRHRSLSLHKPKLKLTNKPNALLNWRRGRRRPLPRNRRPRTQMPRAHGSSWRRWMARPVVLRPPWPRPCTPPLPWPLPAHRSQLRTPPPASLMQANLTQRPLRRKPLPVITLPQNWEPYQWRQQSLENQPRVLPHPVSTAHLLWCYPYRSQP